MKCGLCFFFVKIHFLQYHPKFDQLSSNLGETNLLSKLMHFLIFLTYCLYALNYNSLNLLVDLLIGDFVCGPTLKQQQLLRLFVVTIFTVLPFMAVNCLCIKIINVTFLRVDIQGWIFSVLLGNSNRRIILFLWKMPLN